ncbi:MAG TPA: SPFH domain-containing protein [Candidatus Limnocylindrales bacterium]|nr:SPFH domain-containing protein [Candidatus Limnocylindrales bacterium]
MAVIDLVKYDGNPNIFAWKYPSEQLSTWTQLIVNESQEAFLVKGGVYEGPLQAGRHTLSTENIPVLSGLMGIPFGGRTPFSAEVWYVNLVANLDIRWGTPDPIQLQDPKYQLMLPVRAFGQYGVRISDSKKFLNRLVGTLPQFDAATLAEYFRGIFITRIKTEIANAIIKNGQSVLEVTTQLDTLSAMLRDALTADIEAYGVRLSQFNVNSISVPDDDPAVRTLKSALAKRAEMSIVGFNYQQERSFDVMQQAAGNEGTAGTVLGAGLGTGIGLGVGVPIGQGMGQIAGAMQFAPPPPGAPPPPPVGAAGPPGPPQPPPQAAPPQTPPAPAQPAPAQEVSEPQAAAPPKPAGSAMSPAERIQALRDLGELKTQGILTEAEFEAEKARILSS